MAASIFELPSGAFRFEMGLRRGDAAFFRNTPADDSLLAERVRWLDTESARYAVALPGSEELLEEAASLARSLNPGLVGSASDPAALGKAWAPDFLLLSPKTTGPFLLRAGCVCFPSHWDLGEKIGCPMAEIHAPVPTLNESLGRQIDAFLTALRPGMAWERWNWGLAATPERNDHPARGLPRLAADATIDRVWLRAEHQAFLRLPQTGAVLFGIRLLIEPLGEIVREPRAAERLAQLLETMPEAVARYKGVGQARAALIAELRRASK